jgi:hypothetical protein
LSPFFFLSPASALTIIIEPSSTVKTSVQVLFFLFYFFLNIFLFCIFIDSKILVELFLAMNLGFYVISFCLWFVTWVFFLLELFLLQLI